MAGRSTGYRHGVHWVDRNTCRFAVWAPAHTLVSFVPEGGTSIPMQAKAGGWHVLDVVNPPPSVLYRYQIGDTLLPDPVSHFQPEGINGPSEVVLHHSVEWKSANPRRAMKDLILYEVHIGTFTPEGTFEAAIERLADVAALGVTAIEVMPLAQFSGKRNWGYDGVFPYAVQNSYGGPQGFQQFVDAAHGHGLSVILDVVYNHAGPEGNVLPQFGEYFSQKHHTPWGPNFDLSRSEVRDYIVQNVLHWIIHYRVDGLRLDAVQCIHDGAERHILRQIADTVEAYARRTGRSIVLIAESDENDMGLVRHSHAVNSMHLDAQWSDDFHHALHALITGETVGFYGAYGGVETLASVLRKGFHYTGQYNHWKQKKHGSDPCHFPEVSPSSFVAFSQNHDMVGNRPHGERLHSLVPEAAKCVAALTLLSPFTPLLFMGEEYGDPAPFPFMTDYISDGLKRAVTRGRNRELLQFGWPERGLSPSQKGTFTKARLHWGLRKQGEHADLLRWYKECIALRTTHPAWAEPDFLRQIVCVPTRGVLAMGVWPDRQSCMPDGDASACASCWLIVNCSKSPVAFRTGMLPLLPEADTGTGALLADVIPRYKALMTNAPQVAASLEMGKESLLPEFGVVVLQQS